MTPGDDWSNGMHNRKTEEPRVGDLTSTLVKPKAQIHYSINVSVGVEVDLGVGYLKTCVSVYET
jgi:hypothetical protein